EIGDVGLGDGAPDGLELPPDRQILKAQAEPDGFHVVLLTLMLRRKHTVHRTAAVPLLTVLQLYRVKFDECRISCRKDPVCQPLAPLSSLYRAGLPAAVVFDPFFP